MRQKALADAGGTGSARKGAEGIRMKSPIYESSTERWGIFELAMEGPADGNPFTEHWIRGVFKGSRETVACDGFYDGEGIYRIRFMPSFEGNYTFEIMADFAEELTGDFVVLPPEKRNHGPVRVANTWHFEYEDGTPYYCVGTTCYVWELQTDELIEETLRSLEKGAFNKIRMCVFPKHYAYNLHEPRSYPYEGSPVDSKGITQDNFSEYTGRTEGNHWDFTRFHVPYFQHLEKCIAKLEKLGIEADLILMHPYDRWGFSSMKPEEDDLYIRYMAARLSAFHNVWWSLANEYDLMPAKRSEDWERFAAILCEKDPYRHLKSIHNCGKHYEYRRPWVTHCSVQRTDLYKSGEMVEDWRIKYGKPVVMDEMGYEGDIQYGWGNLTGEEMLRRCWEAVCRGGYPGHGETYLNDRNILWWSHGGALHGESHKRMEFLLEIMRQTPGRGLMPCHREWDEICATAQEPASQDAEGRDYYLFYYSFMRPSFREFYFDEASKWEVHVLDTWSALSVRRGIYSGHFRIELPAKPYMAIQIRRVLEADGK